MAVAAEQHVEDVAIDSEDAQGNLHATAVTLTPLSDPVLQDLDGINVPLPVQLLIKRDAQGRVRVVEQRSPSEMDKREAAEYVKSLKKNGQLSEEANILSPGTTHVIEVESSGRRVLRRRGFNLKE